MPAARLFSLTWGNGNSGKAPGCWALQSSVSEPAPAPPSAFSFQSRTARAPSLLVLNENLGVLQVTLTITDWWVFNTWITLHHLCSWRLNCKSFIPGVHVYGFAPYKKAGATATAGNTHRVSIKQIKTLLYSFLTAWAINHSKPIIFTKKHKASG